MVDEDEDVAIEDGRDRDGNEADLTIAEVHRLEDVQRTTSGVADLGV